MPTPPAIRAIPTRRLFACPIQKLGCGGSRWRECAVRVPSISAWKPLEPRADCERRANLPRAFIKYSDRCSNMAAMHKSARLTAISLLVLAAAFAQSGYHQIKKIAIPGDGFWD